MVDHTLFAWANIVKASVAVSFHAAEKNGPDRRGSADVSCVRAGEQLKSYCRMHIQKKRTW